MKITTYKQRLLIRDIENALRYYPSTNLGKAIQWCRTLARVFEMGTQERRMAWAAAQELERLHMEQIRWWLAGVRG